MSLKLTDWSLALLLFTVTCGQVVIAQGNKKEAGSTNQTTYSPKDVIASNTNGTMLLNILDEDEKKKVAALFDGFIATQSNGFDLLSKVLASANPALLDTPHDVIIIHAVSWDKIHKLSGGKTSDTYQPIRGSWVFCSIDKSKKCHQDFDLSGTPYLYNAPNIYFIDLNYFPDIIGGGKGTFAYQITTTPRQKQNASGVATLVSALLKLPSTQTVGKVVGGAAAIPIAQVWGEAVTVKASSPIPYDLAISATFTANTGNEKDVSCDKSVCSFSKKVTHYDREYWDVSLGVSIAGVLEPKYSSTGTLTSPTRHTDAYAFLDIYPFQYFAEAPASLTHIPHFNLGLPITGQTLHRPYTGLAENLGLLTKKIKLNIPLSVFAGPVFMKQQVYSASTAGLKWDHATKMMYGLELPISSITKYVKGGSGTSNNAKPSGSPTTGGG